MGVSMKNPDDFILDCLVQPVVDQLPDNVSCFDVARIALIEFTVLDFIYDLGRYTLGKAGLPEISLRVVVTAASYYYMLSLFIRPTEIKVEARPNAMNPARIEFLAIFLSWFWMLDFVFSISSNEMLLILSNACMCCVWFFTRANPRPPGKQRKTLLPSFFTVAPQGAV